MRRFVAIVVVLLLGTVAYAGYSPNPTPGPDTIAGTSQADGDILCLAGDDTISCNGGDDGTAAAGVWGNEGNDTLFGNGGDDRLLGNKDEDRVWGGDDDDQCFGNEDNDKVYGEDGDDLVVYGGTGDDLCNGGEGAELLIHGEEHNDTVRGENYGAAYDDVMWGGTGSDHFYDASNNDEDTYIDSNSSSKPDGTVDYIRSMDNDPYDIIHCGCEDALWVPQSQYDADADDAVLLRNAAGTLLFSSTLWEYPGKWSEHCTGTRPVYTTNGTLYDDE